MVIVYFDNGASATIDCSLERFLETATIAKKENCLFVNNEKVAVCVRKITHIEEVEEV